jgi:hypothetical protein
LLALQVIWWQLLGGLFSVPPIVLQVIGPTAKTAPPHAGYMSFMASSAASFVEAPRSLAAFVASIAAGYLFEVRLLLCLAVCGPSFNCVLLKGLAARQRVTGYTRVLAVGEILYRPVGTVGIANQNGAAALERTAIRSRIGTFSLETGAGLNSAA